MPCSARRGAFPAALCAAAAAAAAIWPPGRGDGSGGVPTRARAVGCGRRAAGVWRVAVGQTLPAGPKLYKDGAPLRRRRAVAENFLC